MQTDPFLRTCKRILGVSFEKKNSNANNQVPSSAAPAVIGSKGAQIREAPEGLITGGWEISYEVLGGSSKISMSPKDPGCSSYIWPFHGL